MRQNDLSPPSSPARKKQRLSSPIYDQFPDFSQENLALIDAIEAKLSQGSINRVSGADNKRVKAIAETLNPKRAQAALPISALPNDPDNPFTSGFASAANIPSSSRLPVHGFTTPRSIVTDSDSTIQSHEYERSPSPDPPPLPDYNSWFQSATEIPPIAFQAASFVSAAANAELHHVPAIGFMKASKKGVIAPSEEALAKAKERMNDIWSEDSHDTSASTTASHQANSSQSLFTPASGISLDTSAKRTTFQALENSSTSPPTPGPQPPTQPTNTIRQPPTATARNLRGAGMQKPFKSPFIDPTKKSKLFNSPGIVHSPLRTTTFSTAGSQHHGLTSTPVQGPKSPSKLSSIASSSITPMRPISQSMGRRSTPAPFVTPFKVGMKPGQPGHLRLQQSARAVKPSSPAVEQTTNTKFAKGKTKELSTFFDLTKPHNRKTLSSSGLVPQTYTSSELEMMGINMDEMNQLNPNLAIYYSFHTSSPSSITNSGDRLEMHLGPSAALEELLQRGCSFATKPWVDNHWCLILWKLAGMVALEPESEHSPVTKRWCWSEVIRQLLYRYERELNSGRRPALRLIVTQDAPAAYPIVLCISGISWSEASITDDGIPVEPHPELEVTDGWYRLRAQVDAPLARAIRRGIISIGRKISVAGARLSSERKEPAEILESYNSSKLIISGNSSHLAPWHTKLGFQAGACISTLHSLTADGGVVAAMDLVVIKAYPVAFLEFLEDENGKKTREGPRSEADESVANERWRKRREVEASKLHSELDARVRKYEGYAERLEQRAGPHFRFGPDGPPGHIERLYDDLEEPSHASRLLGRLSQDDAGWLAKHIRNTIDKERDSAAEGMELLLNDACPPRDVRSFRILVVQDARTCRRPSHRTAQLTVWDVLNLSLSEGTTPGTFTVGQRFLVTNLIPTQISAWMDCEPGSEVYLSTRRDSRWTKL